MVHRVAQLSLLLALLVSTVTLPAEETELLDRMAKEHRDDTPVATGITREDDSVHTAGETVTYAVLGDRAVTGYLARPEGATTGRPAVLVIHEWWGLNDNVRAMARRLAEEGYAALAVDLYGGEAADTPERARELATAVRDDPTSAEEILRQAYRYLVETLEAPKVGTIGWCFGGGWSLRAALLFPDGVDATVIYYGRLETDPEVLAPLTMPILGLFGSEDTGIPVDTVEAFRAALEKLGKDVTVKVYEGAGHAFANPSGQRYVPEAAEDAWARTTAFFSEHLEESAP